jgi:hypothetical protein
MKSLAVAIVFIALTPPLSAQWLTQPTPGIPRHPDGQPQLAAPAPRTPDGRPDFSGIWTKVSRTVSADLMPTQPWIEPLVRERREDFSKDNMTILCLPLGPRYITSPALDVNIAGMMKVIQTPTLIVMLHPDLTYRQIFMDGRALETDPSPSWMGYSVGRWEGDTLVVESVGFNARTWLDNSYPHTEALRTIERYRRTDFGHLELDVTLHDPALYAMPYTATLRAELRPDTELLEYVCSENTRSREHWVGKLSDARRDEATIAPGVLETYAGTYVEEKPFWGAAPAPRIFTITFADGALFLEQQGANARVRTRLVAHSDTLFSNGGLALTFVKDTQGVPTHLLDTHVSGDYRFARAK